MISSSVGREQVVNLNSGFILCAYMVNIHELCIQSIDDVHAAIVNLHLDTGATNHFEVSKTRHLI